MDQPIIIIGAGTAGLYCGELLNNAGVPVVVLEASPAIGGRVKSVQFVDWGWKHVDIGADFIHGNKTILKKYVDRTGFPYRKLFTWAQGDGPAPGYHIGRGAGMYYLGLKKKLVRWDTDDEDVTKVNSILWGIGGNKELRETDPRSLEQFLRDSGVSEEGIGLAEAGYANTMCSAIDRLPVSGVLRLENAWSRDGDGLYRLDNGMNEVIDHMARNLLIHTNCEVVSIDYSGSPNAPVTVKCRNGKTFVGRKVVCTASINILKRNAISFVPDLPREHKLAIDTFKMYIAVKVCIEFSDRFWPQELHGMICGHCFIPEFWFEDPEKKTGALMPESAVSDSEPVTVEKKSYLVTGYACAKSAEKITALKKDEIVKRAIAQLDEIFSEMTLANILTDKRPGARLQKPTTAPTITNPKNPATKYYIDSMLIDWGKNPTVRGGYSSPCFGATPEMRAIFSRPVNQKLYFAGEGFNKDSIMTMHGAMETSVVVASDILKEFGKKVAKL